MRAMGVPDEPSRVSEEAALRARVLAGDQHAWCRLYEPNFEALFAHAYHRTGRDIDRTEDVVQECWMVAVRRLRAFNPQRANFETWLRGICDNVLRNERRRWVRREKPTRSLSAEEGISPESGPEAACARGELAEQIAAALAVLPAGYRRILRAKYEERISVAEIAQRSGGTVKSTESLLTRARAAFRKVYAAINQET